MDIVRVLRVIEYEGPRDKIEAQIARSMCDGTHHKPIDCTIKVATVGTFPAILNQAEGQ